MTQFDPKKTLVMAEFRTVLGHDLQPGTPLTVVSEPGAAGEVDEALAQRLWASGLAAYDDEFSPTPIETREQEAERLVKMEEAGSGWFTIHAPWMRKVERVQGRRKAERRYRAIVAAGRTESAPEESGEGEQAGPDGPGSTKAGRNGGAVRGSDTAGADAAVG